MTDLQCSPPRRVNDEEEDALIKRQLVSWLLSPESKEYLRSRRANNNNNSSNDLIRTPPSASPTDSETSQQQAQDTTTFETPRRFISVPSNLRQLEEIEPKSTSKTPAVVSRLIKTDESMRTEGGGGQQQRYLSKFRDLINRAGNDPTSDLDEPHIAVVRRLDNSNIRHHDQYIDMVMRDNRTSLKQKSTMLQTLVNDSLQRLDELARMMKECE